MLIIIIITMIIDELLPGRSVRATRGGGISLQAHIIIIIIHIYIYIYIERERLSCHNIIYYSIICNTVV